MKQNLRHAVANISFDEEVYTATENGQKQA